MMALAQELTASGRYVAVLVSVEGGSALEDNLDGAEQAILCSWQENIEDRLPTELAPPPWIEATPGQAIRAALRGWSRSADRPLVIFIDEIDSLQNQVLISILRQLRDGYGNRPKAFPHSLALIGLRDVRDYKIASGGSDRLNTSSPFNIKAASLTIRNFNEEEVAELYRQHTADTGQIFTDSAIQRAFDLTQGQPWLVNALVKEVVEELVPDRTIDITPDHIDQAKEILIKRMDTHLDSLVERLKEPRVRHVIEPILAGDSFDDIQEDDRRFVIDLGLVKRSTTGGLEIANPIYKEVLPRVLASNT
jgi:hypothetical protein